MLMVFLFSLTSPPNYHQQRQDTHSNEHRVHDVLIMGRLSNALGNQPAHAKLPGHTLSRSNALAEHELPDWHMRESGGSDNWCSSGRQNTSHDDDACPPLIKQVFNLEQPTGVKHPSKEANCK
jgi:hypothetical protein